jgi:hypothetical protein
MGLILNFLSFAVSRALLADFRCRLPFDAILDDEPPPSLRVMTSIVDLKAGTCGRPVPSTDSCGPKGSPVRVPG